MSQVPLKDISTIDTPRHELVHVVLSAHIELLGYRVCHALRHLDDCSIE